jgi:RNase P/RNase MRP subunit p29
MALTLASATANAKDNSETARIGRVVPSGKKMTGVRAKKRLDKVQKIVQTFDFRVKSDSLRI